MSTTNDRPGDEHMRNAPAFYGTPCEVVRADWPYECTAKDRNPTHEVYRCQAHSVWWHKAPEVAA